MRTPTKRLWKPEVQLRDGFYIEVCNKGLKKGVKIRSETKNAMEFAATQYKGYKIVFILGEYRKGIPFIEPLHS